jgi:hypothetical protein
VKRGVLREGIFNRSDADALWLKAYTPPGFEQYQDDLALAMAVTDQTILQKIRSRAIAGHDIELA